MQTTNNPTKRRTALYARVSTADQKTGLEAQIRALRIFCEQNKIESYELFAYENQIGTKAALAAKRKKGIIGGRPKIHNEEAVSRARGLRAEVKSLSTISQMVGISKTRLHQLLK